MVLVRKTMLLEVFLLLFIGSSTAAQQGCTVELADKRALDAETLCDSNNCFWIAATEQDGTETGRCYQCSQQQTQEDCTLRTFAFGWKGATSWGERTGECVCCVDS
jgi:hypothetical protein